METRHDRTRLMIGEEGIERLKNVRVLVLGCGGVGGYVIEALARSGVGTIGVVDNDSIHLSNFNRQIIADKSHIGQQKVDAIEERVSMISSCRIEKYPIFLLPETMDKILWKSFDYIVDAIDTITTKIAVSEYCFHHHIPLISCMGTGNKMDPTKLEVADLFETSVCPVCRVMRHELKKRGIARLEVCYSKEVPQKCIADTEGSHHSPGSMIFVPASAGILIAKTVIRHLLSF